MGLPPPQPNRYGGAAPQIGMYQPPPFIGKIPLVEAEVKNNNNRRTRTATRKKQPIQLNPNTRKNNSKTFIKIFQ